MAKVSKKKIVSTLRTYDVTKICALYKNIFGYVPTEKLQPYGLESTYTYLDYLEVYKWASDFATSNKMDSLLYDLLRNASHYKHRSFGGDKYCYAKHGIYEPLEKHHIVNYMLEQCKDVKSNYAKRPMMGHTHLYFCSPVYGHRDYNKWQSLPIKGNERFCELVIKYADRFFGPVYDKADICKVGEQ